EVRVIVPKLPELRQIVNDHILRSWVLAHEILMFGLGDLETAGFDPRRDWLREALRRAQSGKVPLRDPPLVGILREDRGTVALADVRPLTVHLRGVVRDHEEDLEKLLVADLAGVVADAHRLGEAGSLAARPTETHPRSAGIARYDVLDPFDMLVEGLGPPEAAPCENCNLGLGSSKRLGACKAQTDCKDQSHRLFRGLGERGNLLRPRSQQM